MILHREILQLCRRHAYLSIYLSIYVSMYLCMYLSISLCIYFRIKCPYISIAFPYLKAYFANVHIVARQAVSAEASLHPFFAKLFKPRLPIGYVGHADSSSLGSCSLASTSLASPGVARRFHALARCFRWDLFVDNQCGVGPMGWGDKIDGYVFTWTA